MKGRLEIFTFPEHACSRSSNHESLPLILMLPKIQSVNPGNIVSSLIDLSHLLYRNDTKLNAKREQQIDSLIYIISFILYYLFDKSYKMDGYNS